MNKTKTLRFGHNGGPHDGRFDFLGFEFYWEPDRKVKLRTATKKHIAALQRIRQWIREHRAQKQCELFKTLKAKLQGTWDYYGLIGNFRRMQLLYQETCRALHKWLNRRSQRKSLTWPEVDRLLARFQVPTPRIMETKAMKPCQLELSFCQRILDKTVRSVIHAAHARAS